MNQEEIRYTGDAEEYLLQIPMFTKEKHSLETVRDIYRRIGRFPRGKIIHVAGTNGKGSVCAFLDSALRECGYSTGLFTSPHLKNVRERISVNGKTISSRDFEHCFRIVLGDVRACMREGISHPSFFEFLFYMAMVFFSEQDTEYIILETGLGGRLDTTNICSPAVTVITSVSMDHMEYLGDTLEEIAGEKAGIIKENIPVVFAADEEIPKNVIQKKAKTLDAPVFPVCSENYKIKLTDNRLTVTVPWEERKDPVPFRLSGPALYQGENAALAFKTLEVLRNIEKKEKKGETKITASRAAEGIERVKWPARMEEILPDVFVDGAHNADGIWKFTETVNAMKKKSKLIFSAAGDKEYSKMAEILCKNIHWEKIFVAHMDSKRAAGAQAMAEAFKKYGTCPIEVCSSIPQAFQKGLEDKQKDEALFCAGSLYAAGEIKEAAEEYEHRYH